MSRGHPHIERDPHIRGNCLSGRAHSAPWGHPDGAGRNVVMAFYKDAAMQTHPRTAKVRVFPLKSNVLVY